MEKPATISLKLLSDIKTSLVEFFPTLASCFIILIFGVVLAYLIRWGISSFIKIGVKPLEGKFSGSRMAGLGVEPLRRTVGQIAFFIVIFLTVATVLKKLGLEVVSTWLEHLSKYLPNVVAAIIIIYLGWKIKEFLEETLPGTLQKAGLTHTRIISKALSWAVLVTTTLISLDQIGVDMGLIVTVTAVVGGVLAGGIALTFALGSKSTISDILNCYQIQKIIKKGSRIKFGETEGTVLSIGPVFVVVSSSNGEVAISGSRLKLEMIQVFKGEAKQ